MSAVEVESVTKRFGGGPPILEGIGLSANEGDFSALIGPSGCGKTTLLRLIAGLTGVTSGRIAVGGRPPAEASDELAYVFQDPTLLPWLTAADNVGVPLRLRGLGSKIREARAREALARVGLADRAGHYPRELSGGQRMRVSLARALAAAPGLLLLDEPFGALDAMTRDRLNEELLALRQAQAWTAFFVTHSVAEAVFLANRIFVLSANPGRIHAEIAVDLPYPRTEATRRSRDYQDLVARVAETLRTAGEQAGEGKGGGA